MLTDNYERSVDIFKFILIQNENPNLNYEQIVEAGQVQKNKYPTHSHKILVLGYSRTECHCNTNAFESLTGAVGFLTAPSTLTLGETETSIPGEFGMYKGIICYSRPSVT